MDIKIPLSSNSMPSKWYNSYCKRTLKSYASQKITVVGALNQTNPIMAGNDT